MSSANAPVASEKSLDPTVLRHVFGGVQIASTSDETLPVVDPATGREPARVPRETAKDVDRAVAAAARALPLWRAQTPADRAAALLAVADAVDAELESLARLESLNTGGSDSATRCPLMPMSEWSGPAGCRSSVPV